MSTVIAIESFGSADARRLIGDLDLEMARHYKPSQMFGRNLRPEQVDDGAGTFLVARRDGVALGCGAPRRRDPESAEVKRMYVVPQARGRGLARQIQERLEAAAREMGVERLVLETGVYQGAAIALYESCGYERVPCWGEYATSATSICYAKRVPAAG